MKKLLSVLTIVLFALVMVSESFAWQRGYNRGYRGTYYSNRNYGGYYDRYRGSYYHDRYYRRGLGRDLAIIGGAALILGTINALERSYYSYPSQPTTCECSEPREKAQWVKDPSGEWQLEKSIVYYRYTCPCR